MIFADSLLARRVEAAEAANARGTCGPGVETLNVAGGCAVFAGAGSPLTQAVGLGLAGPVSLAEVEALEDFFRCRGSGVSVDLCPLADPGFLDLLAHRGYAPTEFNNVLVKRLAAAEPVPSPRVRLAAPEEGELWARTVGRAFFETAMLSDREMDVGRAIVATPGVLCYLAFAENGEAAAGAAMACHGGVATLFADGAIPAFRRAGLHRELIAARVDAAAAVGCDVAAAATLPGSASQRNYERLGFQVVYTKVTLVKPLF